jgi:hypothetical protein
MNQPVEVGLEFPRSGQRLFVHVPAQIANSVEMRRLAQSVSTSDYVLRQPTVPHYSTQDSAAHRA